MLLPKENLVRLCLMAVLLPTIPVWAGGQYHANDLTDITIYGAHKEDGLGIHMADAGDVNGDGYDDIVLGTDKGIGDVGEPILNYAYIIYGGTDLPDTMDLLTPPEGTLIFEGFRPVPMVTGLGDMNGDGYDDVLLGDPAASPEGGAAVGGQVLIFFGGSDLPTTIDIKDPVRPLVRVAGTRGRGLLGYAVGRAGDVNGDGFMDALATSRGITDTEPKTEAVLIYGGTDLPDLLYQNQLGSHGVRFISAFDKDGLGQDCKGAGDVNGDGLDDILIGAYRYGSPSGAYLIYGATDFPEVLSMADLGDRGVTFPPVADVGLGYRVSGAGDVNGDGLADFMISSPWSDPSGVEDAGEVHLIFGATDLPSTITKSQIRNYGVTIQGIKRLQNLGDFLSGGVDVNHDGYFDPLFGSGVYDLNTKILLGSPTANRKAVLTYDRLDLIEISMGMGLSEYLGDVNGDGWREIAVGSFTYPYLDRGGSGRVKILGGGKFDATPTETPTLTPTPEDTPTPTITATPTPSFTPRDPEFFSGWILSGEGRVKITPEPDEANRE